MTLPRARILRGASTENGSPMLLPGPSAAQHRRIAREELEATLKAEGIVEHARAAAGRLLSEAREAAALAAERAERAVAEQVEAMAAARFLALRMAEGARLERDVDRVIDLAVVLAERLLGAALEVEPSRIAELARTVIAEARGARRVVIDAHPLDAEALRHHLGAATLDLQPVEGGIDVREDEELARGALRLHTDVGTIDAKLTPRLERLAAALRDVL